jgi:exodeoxyribonuclease V gamma subunit
MLNAVLPETSADRPLTRETMTFGIYALLPRLVASDPDFDPLGNYLVNDDTGVKRLHLAEQIAYLFDQYLVFRPDMILAWDEGQVIGDDPHQRWQSTLWRELGQHHTTPHRARLWRRMLDALARGSVATDALPPRVSVFGISYLPPFYLQVLWALSREMTVDYYQMNPCREFWADIVSRGEEKKWRRPLRERKSLGALEDYHLEEGNRLLASMGRQGRAFHRLIGDWDISGADDYQRNPGTTLLAAVQNDILHLRNRPPQGEDRATAPLDDRSIQIHACHNPMREIEVLYDQLLDLLNNDPQLEPRDILVLTPDIDRYAPFVQAVFGAPEDRGQRLPFSIADRGPLPSRPLVEAFFLLLNLKRSRFPAREIISLLEITALRARFALSDDDIRLIEQWVEETRIRWGVDATSKTQWGLPPSGENTWQTGLDRLLMGYAMPFESGELYQGILPAAGAEGANADVLGRLVHFIEMLHQWQRQSQQTMPAAAWSLSLTKLVDTMFQPTPGEEPDLWLIRGLIGEMRQSCETAGMLEPVGIEVVRTYLERRLQEERSGAGFISGGITFGALLPMRSIPAKVICLVGLNQDVFPREDRALGFDLMAAAPRLGDRSRRHDDRYLFLEALVSARHCFYLSYTGFDLQDNTPLPPSVLVSELVDAIVEAYPLCEADLTTQHRLQAFSPAYFNGRDPRFFSYSRQSCDAARQAATASCASVRPPSLVVGPLPEWDDAFQTVDIDRLARAIAHPCRFLLAQRLRVRLDDDRKEEDDRESFTLDPLDQFHIGQDLLKDIERLPSAATALAKARALGQLPHGDPGSMRFEEIYGEAGELVRALQTVQADTAPETLAVQVQMAGFTITGRLENIYPAAQLCYRYSRTKGIDLIGAWIRHLLWCHLTPDRGHRRTILINRDGQRCFQRAHDPEGALRHLLSIYLRAGHEPLPFFPRSSWDYAQRRFEKNDAVEKALQSVRSRWRQSFVQPGEGEDPYIQYCFRDAEPLDDAFVTLTEAIYQPILQSVEIL